MKGVTFDFLGAHLAYTEESQGGAASLKNEAYLFKAEDIEKELSQAQLDILAEIGEESTPLDKSNLSGVDNDTSSSLKKEVGEDDDKTKIEEDKMSEEMSKELKVLKHELAVMKVTKSLVKHNFDAELESGLANAMANLSEEEVSFVNKALESLVTAGETALTKALEAKKEENPLAKALDVEEGHEAKAEGDDEKTFVQKCMEAKAELVKGAK